MLTSVSVGCFGFMQGIINKREQVFCLKNNIEKERAL